MLLYDKNVNVVMETIKKYRYGPVNILFNEECYVRLKKHFVNVGVTVFDLKQALNWCTSICKRDRGRYRIAVQRLSDVYENGRVLSSHLTVYGKLSPAFNCIIDEYISSLAPYNYSEAHLEKIKEQCLLFFRYAEINGIYSMREINYTLLDQYHQFIVEADGSYRDYEFALIPMFNFCRKRGMCQIGYSLYFRYAKFGKCTSIEDISLKNKKNKTAHRNSTPMS